jgi:nucleotidyltransferase/DNA polymerase involved in DNA repair
MDKQERARKIIHLDMDAFYPAVEVLDNPELKGKPVIVGGSRGRGVVSSASYEARKFGVHSAQPMATAMRLCPSGIFLPVRMSRYREVSRWIFEIFHLFTPLVEPLTIDEAFLDVTGSARLRVPSPPFLFVPNTEFPKSRNQHTIFQSVFNNLQHRFNQCKRSIFGEVKFVMDRICDSIFCDGYDFGFCRGVNWCMFPISIALSLKRGNFKVPFSK